MKILCSIAAAIVALVSSASTNGLEGDWQLCVTGPGSPTETCARIHVDSFAPLPRPSQFGNRASTFRHTINLNAVLGFSNGGLSEFGTLVTNDSLSKLFVYLGTQGGSVYGGDGGWFVATLTRSPDSLYGSWVRSCRGGCPERGRVVFRRAKSY
jgi:hypothetical protein